MTTEIQLPDYLQGLVDDTAKDMISAVGASVPRISIRGRQFRFIVDGEEQHKQTEPIHVIILGVVPDNAMAKTFYINGYQPGSTDPPDCSSFFGLQPDSWVPSPQATNCRDCEQNKWGSAVAMNGKKAKACKDSKRLIVISAKDAAGMATAEEKPIKFIFNVTIASLKALSTYGKFLLSNKLPMAAVITKIEFADAEFPQVDFTFSAVLKKEIGMVMLEEAKEKEWLTGMDIPTLPPPNVQKLSAPAKQEEKPTESLSTEKPESTEAEKPTVDNTLKNANTEDILNKW